jgi:hypothetical protein
MALRAKLPIAGAMTLSHPVGVMAASSSTVVVPAASLKRAVHPPPFAPVPYSRHQVGWLEFRDLDRELNHPARELVPSEIRRPDPHRPLGELVTLDHGRGPFWTPLEIHQRA